jgi:hypothetical protein
MQDEQGGQCIDSSLLRQLQLLRSARLLRLALICQDLADSMTAINDITGGRARGAQAAMHMCQSCVWARGSSTMHWCMLHRVMWHNFVQASACTTVQYTGYPAVLKWISF